MTGDQPCGVEPKFVGGAYAEAVPFTPTGNCLKITGTFFGENTWGFPHQKWGCREYFVI